VPVVRKSIPGPIEGNGLAQQWFGGLDLRCAIECDACPYEMVHRLIGLGPIRTVLGIGSFGCKAEEQGGLRVELPVLAVMSASGYIERRERRVGFLLHQGVRRVAVEIRQVHWWMKSEERIV
jgi:hypothetical protein